MISLTVLMFCVVYGCSNQSNRETARRFFRVAKAVVFKGEKCRKLMKNAGKNDLLIVFRGEGRVGRWWKSCNISFCFQSVVMDLK